MKKEGEITSLLQLFDRANKECPICGKQHFPLWVSYSSLQRLLADQPRTSHHEDHGRWRREDGSSRAGWKAAPRDGWSIHRAASAVYCALIGPYRGNKEATKGTDTKQRLFPCERYKSGDQRWGLWSSDLCTGIRNPVRLRPLPSKETWYVGRFGGRV